MLIRMELIEVSIKHFSASLRHISTGFSRSSGLVLSSTSGLLCLSTSWQGKFWRHIAASRVFRMQVRYNRSVLAWWVLIAGEEPDENLGTWRRAAAAVAQASPEGREITQE